MTSIAIQKRFADVDMLGHVNNVNLQHYFDVGKNDFFLKIFGMRSHLTDIGLITASTNTSYLEQTRLNDNIHVETSIEKLGNKSLNMYQRIVNSDTGVTNVESRSVMVAYDFTQQQSVPISQKWREAMHEHLMP